MPLGTPGTTPSSAVNANAFAKCSPAISNNIRQCGTVTQMNAAVMTLPELTNIFQKSSDFRVMEGLFMHDFEIKMCEAVQNGLYDFLMSQKVSMQSKLSTRRVNSGLLEISPYILARQHSPINNAYWGVTNGATTNNNPAGTDWSVRVASTTNIPADVNSFPVGERVYIDGKSTGGSATRTAWAVYSATLSTDGTYITLILTSQNKGSNLLPYLGDKLGHPVTGILRRGTNNVTSYEKFCVEPPSYLNWKNVPCWVEWTRNAVCKSSLYDNWRKLVLADNPLYKEFYDLDDIEKNKQIGADWQRRLVDNFFWGKPLQYQTLSTYDQLPQIPAFDGTALGLGVNGGAIVGRRANAVGIYEQLAECDRIADAQGQQLNLPALFVELYNMMRVRKGNGSKNAKMFDLFTDSVTAELINQAMVLYYKAKSGNQLQYTYEANQTPKTAEFGFNFRSYVLFWPEGVTINIISHDYFDDWRAATLSTLGANDNTSRVLWVLDFTGIYPGIISSSRVSQTTGDLKTLAAVNDSFRCVMAVPSMETTLTEVGYTVVVDCPASNLIIENFSGAVPEYATQVGNYPASNTSTTSSTAFGG